MPLMEVHWAGAGTDTYRITGLPVADPLQEAFTWSLNREPSIRIVLVWTCCRSLRKAVGNGLRAGWYGVFPVNL